jgi:hypothetical protein
MVVVHHGKGLLIGVHGNIIGKFNSDRESISPNNNEIFRGFHRQKLGMDDSQSTHGKSLGIDYEIKFITSHLSLNHKSKAIKGFVMIFHVVSNKVYRQN